MFFGSDCVLSIHVPDLVPQFCCLTQPQFTVLVFSTDRLSMIFQTALLHLFKLFTSSINYCSNYSHKNLKRFASLTYVVASCVDFPTSKNSINVNRYFKNLPSNSLKSLLLYHDSRFPLIFLSHAHCSVLICISLAR